MIGFNGGARFGRLVSVIDRPLHCYFNHKLAVDGLALIRTVKGGGGAPYANCETTAEKINNIHHVDEDDDRERERERAISTVSSVFFPRSLSPKTLQCGWRSKEETKKGGKKEEEDGGGRGGGGGGGG